ncbi:hypothetical protein EOPP23_00465 [Endozoicomonas sp. OPT23]|uniref:hypothetical protein n=1 Tax=Endozoicomonas sp. OPT23 TaxID=2072845 RepID=UPI00129A9EC4|nr:hypothetical protein [Endozoicomonas sp. OPT23]MRI31462.1 hypothetical protein [Endozoicomonas sp. OPT23]
MKTVKHFIPAVLITAFAASATVHAGELDLYANSDAFSNVTARVFMNGKPLEGARVQLHSNGTMFKSEKMTDSFGRTHFNSVRGSGSVEVKTMTAQGSDSQWINLQRGGDK